MIAKSRIVLVVIILSGALLRVWGLDFGLPFLFHQDEPMMVNHALAFGSGDLNPHYFALPPLTSYILFIAYGILFLAAKVSGIWAGSAEMAAHFFSDPTIFYLYGRTIIGLIPGTVNIYLTYALSRRYMGEKASLFASAVMAFSFLNVINSHYIYVDMFLVMGVLFTFLALDNILNEPSLRNYAVSGLCLGFATGVKYNGIFLVLPALMAHLTASRGEAGQHPLFSPRLWTAVAVSLATVIVTNPYMVLSTPEFLDSVTRQGRAFWFTGWTHHILYSLSEGISLPLLMAGITGLFLLSVKKPRVRIMSAFVVLFYLVIVLHGQHFARYVLPLVPFMALGAGYALLEYPAGKSGFFSTKGYALTAAFVFLMPTLTKSVTADILLSSGDTRVSAAKWIKENLEEGTPIACDSTNFRPVIEQPYSQLVQKKEYLDRQPGLYGAKRKKLDHMLEVARHEGKGYPLYFMFEDPAGQGQFLATMPAIPYSVKTLEAKGIRYVVINEQLNFPVKAGFIENLREKAVVLKSFSPYRSGEIRPPYDIFATTYMPVTSRELYSREKLGPALTIYRMR